MIDEDTNMKAKVEEVLTSSGYSDQRAAKMSLDDLLKYVVFIICTVSYELDRLLCAFHDEGIHFA
jgi:18S rRNA (adenine1779-N6/adenine1780-N6)-dimethyltransferase